MRETWNEFAIEVCKPQERANSFDRDRWFPFLYGREFDRVHFDLSLTDNHAKELDVWCIEDALGKFKR